MDIIKSAKVYNEDGTISNEIPFSVDIDKVRIPAETQANLDNPADFLDQQLVNISNDIKTKADKSLTQVVDLSSSNSANLAQTEIGTKGINPIEKGGTGANSASNARTNLDVPSTSQLNSAYNQANNAINIVNSAYAHANNGYNVANSAYSRANSSYNQANNAYNKANQAYNLANNFSNQINNISNVVNNASSIANTAYNQVNAFNTALFVADRINLCSNSVANAQYAIAIGNFAKATNSECVAIGNNACATGKWSFSIGLSSNASAQQALAFGPSSNATAYMSSAYGVWARCEANWSTAIGCYANVANSEHNTVRLGSDSLSKLSSRVSITITSDERDKTDIIPIKKGAVDFLKKIKAVQYVLNERNKYINEYENLSEEDKQKKNKYGICTYDKKAHKAGTLKGSRKRVGIIAQDVQKALRECYGSADYANLIDDNLYDIKEPIPSDIESKLSANYSAFIPFLIKAIQELDERLSKLELKD